MKASKLMITSNLIEELESIGFQVVTSKHVITLIDEGNSVDITEVFNSEVEAIVGTDFKVESFARIMNDSAINIEAFFVNTMDARGFYIL